MQASNALRQSFERLHHELGDEESLIDWGAPRSHPCHRILSESEDFWGAVMSDYEKVAREQRALAPFL